MTTAKYKNVFEKKIDQGPRGFPGSHNTGAFVSGAQVLNALLTVDGTGSGLDADLLDGQHGSFFAPIASPAFTGNVGIGTTNPNGKLDVASTAGIVWQAAASAGVILGAQGTGTGLLINTGSLNTNYSSGLGVDGTYGAGKSIINIKALGVYSGGYHSNLAFHTTNNTGLNEQMRISEEGKVGIGTTNPTEKLSVAGNINATGEVTAYYSSDARLKENIQKFSGLDLINNIQPVKFKWNDTAKELNSSKDDRDNYGLIAQEVEEILPELIHPIYDKYKSVDYIQLVPILIQAIKELQQEIKMLKQWH